VVVGDGPTEQNPSTAAGERSSASPAAPVSPQRTANAPVRGGRRARRAQSS
jgi:hypothetical protein